MSLDEAILLALADSGRKMTTAEVTKARLVLMGETKDFSHGTAATATALNRLVDEGKVVRGINWKHARVWSLV